MPEWLIEAGIAEHRAIQLDGARITAARMDWPGPLSAGQVEDAVLATRTAGSPRGTARFASGVLALVNRLPPDASPGRALRLEVTRAAMAEQGRNKLAQARLSTMPPRPALTLAEQLSNAGHTARTVRRFPACDWDELWDEAFDGQISFAGGALHIAPTPAMTVIDIDGDLRGAALASAAVPVIGQAIARFDLGGNIAIDFPTLEAKADRRMIDTALTDALDHWPHERTAMNGFGLVQLVARLTAPSLLHRLQFHRAAAAARRLLRQAEAVEQAGTLLLTCHPAVAEALMPDWLEQLARRTGRTCTVKPEPRLALAAGFAQAVTP